MCPYTRLDMFRIYIDAQLSTKLILPQIVLL